MQSTQDRGSEYKKATRLRSSPVLLKSVIPKTEVEYIKIGEYKKIREETYTEASPELDFSQLIKEQVKPSTGALINRKEFVEEENLKALVQFFYQHSHINPKNFVLARKLIINYFTGEENFTHRLILLAQAFDKYSSPNSRFGKLLLSRIPTRESSSQIKICIQRFLPIHSRLNPTDRIEQYISFDLKRKKDGKRDFQVFNQFKTAKENFSELIRDRRSHPNFDKESIKFDVQFWKNTNKGKFLASNYQKILDCIERNSANLAAFIEEINKKSISNLLLPNPIQEAKIKANGKGFVIAKLINSQNQAIHVQISKTISALRLA
jgi:hypothetical protein